MLKHLGQLKNIVIAASLIAGFSSSVDAQQLKTANIAAERQQLFDRMLHDPDNLNVALAYATLSVKVGDLEGAISTLERMLIFSPGLARLQLELGVLYYRLGNFDTAKSYFESATRGINSPAIVAQRAQEYLEIVEKKLKRFVWSSKTFVGLRWQSNVSSAPDATTFTVNNLPFTIGKNAGKKSDFGLVTSSSAHFEYDLHNQGDKLELDYVDFGTKQLRESKLDSAVSEVTFGPSFNLGRFNLDATFASVYAIANGALLDNKAYFGTLGVGSRIVNRPNSKTELVLKGEYRRQWFNNTSRLPALSDQNGDEYRVAAQAKYSFGPRVRAMIGVSGNRNDRRKNFYDNWEFGLQSGLIWAFDPASLYDGRLWTASVNAGFKHRNYDAGDPVLNINEGDQKDNEYWIEGAVRVPLSKSWAFMPKAEYRRVTSNSPIHRYKAFTATIGVEYKQ